MREYVRDELGRFADIPGVGDDAPRNNSATTPGGTRTSVPSHLRAGPKGSGSPPPADVADLDYLRSILDKPNQETLETPDQYNARLASERLEAQKARNRAAGKKPLPKGYNANSASFPVVNAEDLPSTGTAQEQRDAVRQKLRDVAATSQARIAAITEARKAQQAAYREAEKAKVAAMIAAKKRKG